MGGLILFYLKRNTDVNFIDHSSACVHTFFNARLSFYKPKDNVGGVSLYVIDLHGTPMIYNHVLQFPHEAGYGEDALRHVWVTTGW